MMNLSDRQIRILTLMKQHKQLSKQELVAFCHVNERTIRNDIQDMNQRFDSPLLIYKKQQGYFIQNEEMVKTLLAQTDEQVHENRLFYILKSLLLGLENYTIFDFAETLLVSEATIEKDLMQVKELLKEAHQLTLKRIDGYLLIEGAESDKRSFLCGLFIKESQTHNFDLRMFDDCFEYIDLYTIETIIKDVFQNYHIALADSLYHNIILHIAIASERCLQDGWKQMEEAEYEGGEYEAVDSAIAQRIIQRLEEHYAITYPLEERAFFARMIYGKRTFRNGDGAMQTSPSFMHLTKDIIAYIKKVYGLDFQQDEELHQDLSMHLEGLHHRLVSKAVTHNVLMDEIKRNYPFIFEIGIDVAKYYDQITQEQMSQDEIGFVVLHLVCAMERLPHQPTKLRTMIVCPTGYSSSKILEIKLHNAYVDALEIVKTCSIKDFYQEDMQALDFIIATVAIEETIPIPIFQCSPFFRKEDLKRLDVLMRKLKKDKETWTYEDYFDENLFFCDLNIKNQKEVLHFLSSQLQKQGYVDEHYEASVLEREAFSSTSYQDGIAIPHPMQMNAARTKVAIAILAKPITWKDRKVQLIFQLAFREGDKNRLFELYETFAILSDRRDIYAKLLECHDYVSFMNVFQSL